LIRFIGHSSIGCWWFSVRTLYDQECREIVPGRLRRPTNGTGVSAIWPLRAPIPQNRHPNTRERADMTGRAVAVGAMLAVVTLLICVVVFPADWSVQPGSDPDSFVSPVTSADWAIAAVLILALAGARALRDIHGSHSSAAALRRLSTTASKPAGPM